MAVMDGEEFLADAVTGLAVKLLDMQQGFLIAIVVFNRPSTGVEEDNVAEQGLKGLPTELGSGFAHRAAVNAFGLRPQAATTSMSKQIADFGIDALVFAAGNKG